MVTREIEDPPPFPDVSNGRIDLDAWKAQQAAWWERHKLFLRELQDELGEVQSQLSRLIG